MFLYHGTNIKFDKVRIILPNRTLDFGAGFYTTSNKTQAIDWAKVVVKRANFGKPLLNIYEFDENSLQELSVKKFEKPTKEWLDFVCEHRIEKYSDDNYDLIIGPVANDNTMPVLQAYMNAKNKDLYAPVALSEIQAEKLIDQFVFKTNLSLKRVKLKEIIEL
ncbi:MAG: DUF3990 domain-containing protein [Chitinivibrionia bacterium]|nr:DUF3990 domain-containing protein [Chitinivibrionia bacterium]